jgi:peptide/nickel transport system substrate-binding protein
MKRLAIAAVSSAVLVLALVGCGDDDPPPEGEREYQDGATFTMAVSADPGALNPATAVQGATNLLLSFAYDPLVHVGEDGQVLAGLATEWQVEPDAVTFTLHPDATCADGSPVTPETVAASIEYVTDPETGAPLLGVLIPADLTAEPDNQAGTVTLRTGDPNVFLLHSTVAIFIICGAGLDDPATLDEQTSGSGPYELVESVPNDHYTLRVREGYTWGADGTGTGDPGVPAEVVLRVVTDQSTAANLLLSGDIQGGIFTGADRARVEGAPDVLTTLGAGGNTDLFFNQRDGLPGADPAVRRALTQALDLAELATITSQGTGVPSTGLATLSPRPCQVDSVTGHLPEHDPDAAGAELDAAGWSLAGDTRSQDGEPLTIRILYSPDHGAGIEASAEYQADAWEELGAQVELRGLASAAYGESLFTTGDWDAAIVPLGLSLPSQLVGYLSGPGPADGGSNFASLDNPQYADLAGQAAEVPLADGGCDVWAQAESALFDELDLLPLVESTELVAGRGAEVVVRGGLAQPTRIRMLAG